MKQVIITIGTILFTTFLYGQGGVGINNSGNAPNTSAMLDIASTNKGLLIPRVSLTSTTDITTITNGNVTSLLVYNSATIADVVPGYYYWDGTVWKTIGGNDADADPTNEIQDLQLVGNNLTITNNGTPTTIDLSAYLDNTDDQNIDSVILNGSNLTVYIEDGTSSAVDLSSLSDHDWYEVGGATAPNNITDDIYTQGKVGIGNLTPNGTLDVFNNNGRLIMGTGGETLIERNSGNTLIVRNTDNTSTSNLGHVILERGDGSGDDFSITTMSDLANGVDKIGFTFGTSINAVINKTGEVGIGETNPTNKLSIGANLGTGYGISVNSGSPYGGIIETLEATPSSNPAFWVRNTDGTNTSHLFRVQNNGNVGIGTISPNVQLHIESNFPLLGFSDLDDLTDINDIAYIRGQANGLSMGWYDASTNTYATQTHLDGVTGNFGINTTTPTNTLEIAGDGTAYLNNPSAGIRYQNDQTIFIGPKSGSSANGAIISVTGNGAGYVRLNPEGGSPNFQLNVTPTGTGIGTTAPTELLEVQGGSLKIVDGTQGTGKVLISDAVGKASWTNLLGNTWITVTGSRALNTTYTNTSGKPMYVSASLNHPGGVGSATSSFIIDGLRVSVFVPQSGWNVFEHSHIIPVGSTYRINTTGTVSLQTWSER